VRQQWRAFCDEAEAKRGDQRRLHRATRLRLVSIFRRGWMLILVTLLNQAPLPLGAFSQNPGPQAVPVRAALRYPTRACIMMSPPKKPTLEREDRVRGGTETFVNWAILNEASGIR
jgi:hypothetical protein